MQINVACQDVDENCWYKTYKRLCQPSFTFSSQRGYWRGLPHLPEDVEQTKDFCAKYCQYLHQMLPIFAPILPIFMPNVADICAKYCRYLCQILLIFVSNIADICAKYCQYWRGLPGDKKCLCQISCKLQRMNYDYGLNQGSQFLLCDNKSL